MPKILVGFLMAGAFMVAIPLLLGWSGSRRRLRVGSAGGAVVLRMPRGHFAILAALVLVPCAVFAALAFASEWPAGHESAGLGLGAFVSLLGIGGGGWLLGLEVNGRIRLEDEAIERVGAFRRTRVAWRDVQRITFNPINNWFFLTVPGGKRLYVVEGLDGIADFGEVALRRLPPAVLKESPEATEALRELAAM
jgi:hypothetical protein